MNPKSKVRDYVRILEYPNMKTFLHWKFKELFMIKKLKHTIPWTYVTEELNELWWTNEWTVGTFYTIELAETNQTEFRIEKVIKRKYNKLLVTWKGYDNSFNSLISKNNYIKLVISQNHMAIVKIQ